MLYLCHCGLRHRGIIVISISLQTSGFLKKKKKLAEISRFFSIKVIFFQVYKSCDLIPVICELRKDTSSDMTIFISLNPKYVTNDHSGVSKICFFIIN